MYTYIYQYVHVYVIYYQIMHTMYYKNDIYPLVVAALVYVIWHV